MKKNPLSYLRQELQELLPYSPGEQPNLNQTVIKLNTNENPYPPSPKIQEIVNSILIEGKLRKYPHYNGKLLRETISQKFNVDPDQVLITNGSDEALRLLFTAVLSPNDTVIVPDPTYSLYPVLCASLMANIQFERIPLLPNLGLDFDSLKRSKGKLMAFAHPNAPTGIIEKKSELIALVDSFSGIVLSDEAYIDFAQENMSLMDQIAYLPNLVVSRTFSKSYSLAGLRVGYLVGEKSLIQLISKLKDSYNVGLLEQAIALAALEDETYFQKNLKLVISERERLKVEFSKMGFFVTESQTNFLFCKPDHRLNPESIYLALKEKSILVRYFSKGLASEYIRVTIGSPEENAKLLDELRLLLKG